MSSHGDFKTIEASRPQFDKDIKFTYTQTSDPTWTPGSGATRNEWKEHGTISIDPYAEGRKPTDNYKLLISGIIPRPIGFVSTMSKDGCQRNLAPFSYTQVVNHDPPVFCIGFSAGRNMKDSARHLLESGECTINIISEFFIEAANYTAINAPPGVSEWELSGLTPEKSTVVSAPRVKESVFSVEAKLLHSHDWKSKTTGNHTGTLCIVEGLYFHVREDALNEEQNIIDVKVLRPVSRLGGITYGRTTSAFELPRPDFAKEKEKQEVKLILTEE